MKKKPGKMKNFFALLFILINKNLKLLFRSKTTVSIIIFGPIFLILLMGLSFNTSGIFGIEIGINSPNTESQDLISLISQLEEKEFSITKTSNIEQCKDLLKEGKLHLCLDLPDNFDVTGNVQKDVKFYVDYSRINLAFLILDIVTNEIDQKSSLLSESLTNNLLGKITSAEQKINEQEKITKDTIDYVGTIIGNVNKIGNELDSIDTNILVEEDYLDDIEEDVDYLIENYSIDDDDTELIYDRINILRNQISNLSDQLEDINSAKIEANNRLDATTILNTNTQDNLEFLENSLINLKEEISDNPVSDANVIVNPISTSIEPLSTNKTNLDYMAPILIVLVVMFMAMFLSSTIVVAGNSSKAFFRTRISLKTSSISFFASYLTILLVVGLQIIFFLGVSSFFSNISFMNGLGELTATIFLILTFFILLGVVLGYLPTKHETAVLSAVSLSSIFLLFSDLVFPLESMPEFMKEIAVYNPFVLGTFSVNKALLFSAFATNQMITLGVYSIVCIIIISILYKIREMKINK